jgi:hypothetical protein
MDITLSKDSFSQAKLFVATPMYGGRCMSDYLQGMMELSSSCITHGIPMTLHGVVNESLVQKARNTCANAFMQSDFTHLLFIDADVGFRAADALSLLHLVNTDEKQQYDVLAGPYPKKAISWKKIKSAVDQGFSDEDASRLKNFVGNYTFLAPFGKPFAFNKPAEVLEIGTGFMLIPRRTFEKLMQAYPKNTYKEAKGQKQFAFFDAGINPDTDSFMGEDCLFCHTVRKIGGKVWLAPWLQLKHQGTFTFKEAESPSFI